MFRRSVQIKLIAAFVVTFVCLNAFGAACVAYCRSSHSFETTHLSIEKQAHHCDRSGHGRTNNFSLLRAGDRFECCPMTLTFVGAPIEKNLFSLAKATLAVTAKPEVRFVERVFRSISPASVSYRGPPPRDTRLLRIKNRVLRI